MVIFSPIYFKISETKLFNFVLYSSRCSAFKASTIHFFFRLVLRLSQLSNSPTGTIKRPLLLANLISSLAVLFSCSGMPFIPSLFTGPHFVISLLILLSAPRAPDNVCLFSFSCFVNLFISFLTFQ